MTSSSGWLGDWTSALLVELVRDTEPDGWGCEELGVEAMDDGGLGPVELGR